MVNSLCNSLKKVRHYFFSCFHLSGTGGGHMGSLTKLSFSCLVAARTGKNMWDGECTYTRNICVCDNVYILQCGGMNYNRTVPFSLYLLDTSKIDGCLTILKHKACRTLIKEIRIPGKAVLYWNGKQYVHSVTSHFPGHLRRQSHASWLPVMADELPFPRLPCIHLTKWC